MKAIVSIAKDDGSFDRVGTDGQTVLGPYKSKRYLLQKARDFGKFKEVRVQLFFDGNVQRVKPDEILYVKNRDTRPLAEREAPVVYTNPATDPRFVDEDRRHYYTFTGLRRANASGTTETFFSRLPLNRKEWDSLFQAALDQAIAYYVEPPTIEQVVGFVERRYPAIKALGTFIADAELDGDSTVQTRN